MYDSFFIHKIPSVFIFSVGPFTQMLRNIKVVELGGLC